MTRAVLRSMPRSLVFTLILLGVTACAPETQKNGVENGTPPDIGDVHHEARADTGASRVVGTIRVVGSAPFPQVVVDVASQRDIVVTGPLRSEIQRLSGARVEVIGEMKNHEIAATGYRVRSVDGRPAVAGTVHRRDDEVWLRTPDGQMIRLEGATDHLEDGARVWVQGDARMRIHTTGVISEPK